jgi:hypothetical protein
MPGKPALAFSLGSLCSKGLNDDLIDFGAGHGAAEQHFFRQGANNMFPRP